MTLFANQVAELFTSADLNEDISKVNSAELQNLLRQNKYTAVQCVASWNGRYDRELFDLLLSQTSIGDLKIALLNVDDQTNWSLLRELNFTNVPCVILYTGVKISSIIRGLPSTEHLNKELSKLSLDYPNSV